VRDWHGGRYEHGERLPASLGEVLRHLPALDTVERLDEAAGR
jgi:hypothetical protein